MNVFALAGLLVGCASWVDGTWLFVFDQNPSVSGSCAESMGEQPKDLGLNYQLVDIYEADDGSVVVFFDEILNGARDGSSFTADWEERITWDDGSSAASSLELNGTKESGLIVGDLKVASKDVDADGAEETCTLTFDFDAELVTSSDSDFVGD
ncbi:MAG: hypothetical protein GY913_20405 [Proteobacteria bacterium]|nr:hypothetical protein [Pseudomonadota bacterium]MCP4919270.1 hypothetical protein [Pseudomonadota bacterium]